MQKIFRLGAHASAWLAALGLWLGAATAAAQPGEVWIAPAAADAEIDSLADGFLFWLEDRVGRAGIPATVVWSAGADRDALMARAASAGIPTLVFPELRQDDDEVEIALLVYATGSGELTSVARESAPLGELGAASEGVGSRLLALLGLPESRISRAVPPRLDGIAASGRAIAHRNEGQLAAGWHEVDGKLSPTAVRARDAITADARNAKYAGPERARVLAISGQADQAWDLVSAELASTPLAKVPLAWLRAAVEVKLEQNNPRAAREFVDELQRREPDSAATLELLALTLRAQNDTAGAARALERAVAAGASDPRLLSRVARDAELSPERRARLLLQAGRSAAERFETHRAESLLGDAAQHPSLAAEAWLARAELRRRLGLRADALEAYRAAGDASRAAGREPDAALWRGLGRAQRVSGEFDAAETSLRKAVDLAPSDPASLHELGMVLAAQQRDAEAVPMLERAVELKPRDPRMRRTLSRALEKLGDSERALRVLREDPGADTSAQTLEQIAALQSRTGDADAARDTLVKAIALRPSDPQLQARLSEIQTQRNDPEAARRARELSKLLAGQVEPPRAVIEIEDAAPGEAVSLDEFVASFLTGIHDPVRVAYLGMRDRPNWHARLLDWIHPQAPKRGAVEAAIASALGREFTLVSSPDTTAALRPVIEPFFAFDERSSLDAASVAKLNQLLGTDAVFVARFDPYPAGLQAAGQEVQCTEPGSFELEGRLLAGMDAELVSILGNSECLPGTRAALNEWNRRAMGVYLVALMLLMYPVIRGWGSLKVAILTPTNTKGFLHIRISKKPSPVKQENDKSRSDRIQLRLRALSRFERRMASKENLFRWLPARRSGYYVTVLGPLVDAKTEEVIGHFLEEQKVVIRRGKVASLTYDFRPKECAVEVRVVRDGQPEPNAQVAVAGDRASMRYARDGIAYLYLGQGEFEILVGSGDAVACYPLEIRSLDKPIPITVDLLEPRVSLFTDCPQAVAPYLIGDLPNAAAALEAAGLEQLAGRVRAQLQRQLGHIDEAAREFERAGDIEKAAELYAQAEQTGESAALFERAGEHVRAAELYRAGGDIESAARCYAEAYDFDNAIECYRALDRNDQVVQLLEKVGQYMDAGELCRELGDDDRALLNLEQVEFRDGGFFEARRAMAEILVERGALDLAIEKIGGAVQSSSEEGVPLAMFDFLADLLERAGRTEQLLETLETIKRREPHRAGLTDRLASVRSQWHNETKQRDTRVATAGAVTEPPTVAVESRYEVIEEIGRGGMGVVLKARDRELGRLVALKRLPENLREHPKAVALFKREAQAAAALNHRNIVTIYDAGEENGSYFITMELLEGLPLNAILKKRGQIAAKDVVRLGIQIAAGLQYAHGQRIVHRDIKTANLFFTKDKTVKIMDFGLAKTIEEVRRNSTVIGGTPYFMAPEQAVGGELDHRADLYAFGVTLFHLVTGTVPFQDGDLAYHHRHTPAPDPRERDASIPAPFAELILQLLAKDPAGRPADAAAVGARLQEMLTAKD